MPESAIARAVAAWAGVFGVVSFELFGQFGNVVTDRDALVCSAVACLGGMIGLDARVACWCPTGAPGALRRCVQRWPAIGRVRRGVLPARAAVGLVRCPEIGCAMGLAWFRAYFDGSFELPKAALEYIFET
jgi:hypothetical protein